MARAIGMAADATVFRAVIEVTDRITGDKEVKREGPYGEIGAARARVTFWTNYLAELDEETFERTGKSRASGYVERGTVSWERA